MDTMRLLISPLVGVIDAIDGAINSGGVSNAREAIKRQELQTKALRALDESVGFRTSIDVQELPRHRTSA